MSGQAGRNHLERLHFIQECLVLADIAVGATLGYFSVEAYFALSASAGAPAMLADMIWRELVLTSVIAAFVLRDPEAGVRLEARTGRRTLLAVARRFAICAGILAATGSATGTLHTMAKAWLLVWAGAFFLWLCTSRLVLLGWQKRLTRVTGPRQGIAVIGPRTAAARLADRLKRDTPVMRVLETPSGDAAALTKALAGIVAAARDGSVGLVILVHGGGSHQRDNTGRIVEALKAAPVRIAIWAEIDGVQPASRELQMIGGIPLLLVADRPLQPRDMVAKALVDRTGAGLLLLLAMPFLFAIAITVLLETPGPVLFRQARTGRCGRLFTVYKFRTMRHLPGQGPRAQTRRSDSRCTAFGAFLRRTSLDELPQLWNVLCGDMSLVGPRPHADGLHARERATGNLMIDYAQRHRVKPGLTGWAQVQGLRGAADTPDKLRRRIEMDIYYIDHWSIWFDLEILLRTPLAVLAAENAF